MPVVQRQVNDRGDRIEYFGKDIRLTNGSHFIPRAPAIFDHFTYGAGAVNSHVPQNWVTTETGAATPYAPSASTVNGALIGVCGATTNNSEELAGKSVQWQPSTMSVTRSLSLEVRAKFIGTTTATDGDFVIGFGDAVTYASGLPWVVGLTSLYTTMAPVEFAGFHYSSIPTSGTLFNSGANFIGLISRGNTLPATPVATSSGVAKDSLFHVYRVDLDSSGNSSMYIDDKFVGNGITATTAATALTPYIATIAKNSHAQTATIDYISVQGDLV